MGQNADFAATTPWRGVLNKPDFFPTNLDNLDQSGASDGQVAVWNAAKKKWIVGTPTSTVSVEVGDTTTGAAGTDAAVTNVGTPTAVVLDFIIPEGEKGDEGDPGTPGTNGATWYSGSGVPSGGLGANGDYYLRLGVTGNGDVYRKSAGTWAVVGNIQGPTGPSGAGSSIGVATRTALRALTGMVDNQYTVEAGYGFYGDGGGGLWQFVASDNYSTDNDGTLVVPGGSYGSSATVGCWHRVGPGTQGASVLTSTTLDIRWFGALPNDADISVGLLRAFNALLAVPGAKQGGCLYAPGGEYLLANKVVLDGGSANLAFTLRGDGPGATNFIYGLTSADTCMLEIRRSDGGSLEDIGFSTGGFAIVNSPSVVWVHSTTNFTMLNVSGKNLVSTAINDAPGGVFRLGGPTGTYAGENTLLKMVNVSTYGNSSGGSAIYWEAGSVVGTNWNFKTGTNARPCFYMVGCNSFQATNVFLEGGGPRLRYEVATITSTGADFTITKVGHLFLAGDYIRLSGYSKSGYNQVWKIASVTANTLVITSAANLGVDSGTLETLWACAYFGPTAGKVVTESQINSWFCNTGGSPSYGSVGMFLDAWQNGSIGQFSISDSLTDYGYSSVFCHGRMNSDPGGNSSCGGIRIVNQRQNTGTQSAFGGARIEGCKDVSITDFCQFPGDNAPPGTGKTFTAVVVSDGGQAWATQSIVITGGSLTNPHSSALYPSATIIAIQLDGVLLKNVKINRPMVDSAVTVYSQINGATWTNGNSMIYDNNSSQEVLLNAAGTTIR